MLLCVCWQHRCVFTRGKMPHSLFSSSPTHRRWRRRAWSWWRAARSRRPRAGRALRGSSSGSWPGCSAGSPGCPSTSSSLPRSQPAPAGRRHPPASSAGTTSPDEVYNALWYVSVSLLPSKWGRAWVNNNINFINSLGPWKVLYKTHV